HDAASQLGCDGYRRRRIISGLKGQPPARGGVMRAFRFGLVALLALAVSIAGLANAACAQSADELSALNAQVDQLYRAGKSNEAIPIAQQALALAERLNGPDHPTVAIALGNLAVLNQSQGRYAEAEPLYKRGVSILEKALGSEDPSVA